MNYYKYHVNKDLGKNKDLSIKDNSDDICRHKNKTFAQYLN